MKLVVGLGNPGEKYKNSRHNLGFMVLDLLVKREGLSWKKSPDFVADYAKNEIAVYAKPNTFMNQSGIAVKALADFYKVELKDILVVYDEVDLPFGRIRLSYDGLSAGHKGIESVIQGVGAGDFGRVRIGIGKPEKEEKNNNVVAKHVLDDFSVEEEKQLEGIIEKSCEAVRSYMADGIESTMNRFN